MTAFDYEGDGVMGVFVSLDAAMGHAAEKEINLSWECDDAVWRAKSYHRAHGDKWLIRKFEVLP